MKKLFALVARNLKETIRDPLSMLFCLLFPIAMLVLMQAIFSGMGDRPANFEITNYASGICVFGYTFVALFVAMQIAGDKNTSFIKRLNVAPLSKFVYYFGFVCSGLILAFCQTFLFYLIAVFFGYPFDGKFVAGIFLMLFSALFYVSLGMTIGVLCSNERQTGPVSSVVVSAVGILGGIFMPVTVLSEGFASFVKALPFVHTVMLGGDFRSAGAAEAFSHLPFVAGYTVLCFLVTAVVCFVRAGGKGETAGKRKKMV